MGHSLAKPLKNEGSDEPDSDSGLTKQDISNIRRSWAPIWANAETVGYDLVKRMANGESCTKTVLRSFRDMDDGALQKCHVFKAQVMTFMSNINMLVTQLDAPEVAASILQTLEALQTKDKPPAKYFYIMDKEITDFLTEDRKLSDSVVESWKRLLALIHQQTNKN